MTRRSPWLIGLLAVSLHATPAGASPSPDAPPTTDRPRVTLEWLVQELAELYSPEEARLWLFSPHRALGGETPADRIQAGKVDDVLAIIAQLRDGAYA